MNVSLPHLERLAHEGVVFDQATSVAPLTLPAHTSLFTGLLPPNHGVRDNADHALADAHTTLAETLRAGGFRTAASVGSIVLDPSPRTAAGIRAVLCRSRRRPNARESADVAADEVMDDAIALARHASAIPVSSCGHISTTRIDRTIRPSRTGRSTAITCTSAKSHSRTRRSVACSQALEQRHLLDRTVVIVAGDHGESLGAPRRA